MYIPSWSKRDEQGCCLVFMFVMIVGGAIWLWDLVWSLFA